jgi:hypothetical protein
MQQDSDKRQQAVLFKQQRPGIDTREDHASFDGQTANRATIASEDTIKPETTYMAISEALALAHEQPSSNEP